MDKLFEKEYTDDYNCAHFAVDAWRYETGEDISGLLIPAGDGVTITRELASKFERGIGEPSIVLAKKKYRPPHVGLYIRGKVLHLPERGHPERINLDYFIWGFERIIWYRRK